MTVITKDYYQRKQYLTEQFKRITDRNWLRTQPMYNDDDYLECVYYEVTDKVTTADIYEFRNYVDNVDLDLWARVGNFVTYWTYDPNRSDDDSDIDDNEYDIDDSDEEEETPTTTIIARRRVRLQQ